MFTIEFLKEIYDLLEPCKQSEGREDCHPEGNVYTHSFQTLHYALKESDDIDLILAAWCHDIGKPLIRNGHETELPPWIREYFSEKSIWLIENHMRIWAYILGETKKLSKAKGMAEHPFLPQLIQLARWDKMARRPNWFPFIEKEDLLNRLNKKAEKKFELRLIIGGNKNGNN